MAPEVYEQVEQARLLALARKVEEWQKLNNLSDSALVKKVPQLGSTKPYKKILTEDFSEMDVEGQIAEYTAAVAWIESLECDDADDEDWDEDMSGAVALRRAFNRMRSTSGIARCGFVIGPTGSGKSGARTVLMRKFGASLIQVSANIVWRDKPAALLRAIAKATGMTVIPTYGVELYEKVEEKVKDKVLCVMIEEGHHLGPNCLDLIKVLINDTAASFVIFAVDTLYHRMECAAYEQARQLTGNRFAFRIKFDDTMLKRDCERMVSRRVKMAEPLDAHLVKNLVDNARNYGRLAFVREMLKKLRLRADGKPATREDWIAAVTEELTARKREGVKGVSK